MQDNVSKGRAAAAAAVWKRRLARTVFDVAMKVTRPVRAGGPVCCSRNDACAIRGKDT